MCGRPRRVRPLNGQPTKDGRLLLHLRLVLIGLIVSTILTGAVRAQERPNFAGRWLPAGAGTQPDQPLIVSQTATSVSVENWSTSGPASGTYGWGVDAERATTKTPRVSWEGTTLVVVFPMTTWPGPAGVRAIRTERWWLDTAGKLTVSIGLRPEQGGSWVDTVLYVRTNRD